MGSWALCALASFVLRVILFSTLAMDFEKLLLKFIKSANLFGINITHLIFHYGRIIFLKSKIARYGSSAYTSTSCSCCLALMVPFSQVVSPTRIASLQNLRLLLLFSWISVHLLRHLPTQAPVLWLWYAFDVCSEQSIGCCSEIAVKSL